MKKAIIIKCKCNKNNIPTIIKETREERRDRINKSGSSMITKVVPNKKYIGGKKQRQLNKKLLSEVDF